MYGDTDDVLISNSGFPERDNCSSGGEGVAMVSHVAKSFYLQKLFPYRTVY